MVFSDPGFWMIVAGTLLVAFGFIGLAFSRMGNEMPLRRSSKKSNDELQAGDASITELPNPFSTDAKKEDARRQR